MADSEQKASEDQTEAGGDAGATEKKKKKGLMGPLMIGLVLALLLGGGAAYAVMSGLAPIGGGETAAEDAHAEDHGAAAEDHAAHEPPVFVAFDPLTVTLTRGGAPRQLRFEFSIETTHAYEHSVEEMKPRILDALNTLLRALDERELTEPASLDRLRAQMLRRVRIATDPTAVKDLLITEFVVF